MAAPSPDPAGRGPLSEHEHEYEYEAIRVSVEGHVARVDLARPGRRNALNRAITREIVAVIDAIDARSDIKVVIIATEGPDFCAGFDLADPEWAELGSPEMVSSAGRAAVEAVGSARPVTIAAVHGNCVGGGVVLASACDLRIASRTALFRLPEVDLGVPLYWTGVSRLVRELGPAVTKELIMTGRPFGADEARSIRLLNRVVADDQLGAEALALAREIATKPALVLQETCRQIDSALPPVSPGDTLESDIAGFTAAFADPECRQTMASTAQRRQNKPRS